MIERKPREPLALMFAGESEETIKAALDELQTIEPASEQHAAKILRIRDVLLQELQTVQGRLL